MTSQRARLLVPCRPTVYMYVPGGCSDCRCGIGLGGCQGDLRERSSRSVVCVPSAGPFYIGWAITFLTL